MLRLIPLLLLSACGPIQPCLDDCDEDHAFFEACMGADGTLCDGAVSVECNDDPVAMVDCYEAMEAGEECDWNALDEAGSVFACESPEDFRDSCIAVARERFAREDRDGKEERSQACLEPASTDFEIAVEALDCAAVCEWLGVTTAAGASSEPLRLRGIHSAVSVGR